MRIVALLTVRNEERYIKRCLQHLDREGIEVCLIDNGSTDKTLEIVETFTDKNVFRIEHFPYNGSFALRPILENQERLTREIDADWFIHQDADEIRQAPKPYKSLKEAIIEVDRLGYNTINFDEFVFFPTIEYPEHTDLDFVETMRYYYFFEPERRRRINAWKNQSQKVNIAGSGGHKISFENQKIFPQSFILRHYIALSKAHAISKYCSRVYSEKEVIQNLWHGTRTQCHPNQIVLPELSELIEIQDTFNNNWDKSDIWKKHLFMEGHSVSIFRNIKSKVKKKIKSFITKFHRDKVITTSNLSNNSPVPFIVGVGRSGSTLLRLMLDSHPDLSIPPETHFISDISSQMKKYRNNSKQFYKIVTNHIRWPDFHISKSIFLERLTKVDSFTYSDGIRIFYALYAEKFDKKRWGDKTPPYDHHMIEIEKLIPEVRFIHIIRDGRDVALSYKGKWFGPGDNIEDQAKHWVWRIRETRRQAQHLSHYIEIRFEDLINDTQTVLEGICEFIDLSYSPQMLEYYKTANQRLSEMESRFDKNGNILLSREKRLKQFQLTNKPPLKERIGNWRYEMSSEDQLKFEAIAGDLLRDLKY